MIVTLDTMETYRRAEDLAEMAIDFVTAYISEVAEGDPVEVQQMAIHMAGRMLAGTSSLLSAHRG